jgi:4-amino-4-deoxy-L-arabinose transferase-like glycosyltransferase
MQWWPQVLLLGLAVWTQVRFPPQYDENGHIHFTDYIAQHPTWHTLVTYEGSENYEAKAPFVFIVAAVVGSIAGFTLPVMRLLVLLFALIGIHYFRRLVQLIKPDALGCCSSSVVVIPYFLILSLTYMTDIPTLALMFLSFYSLLRSIENNSISHLICGILASTAMVYTRIDAAFILAGIGLACATQRLLPRRMLLGIIIPLLLRLPLVILWGGLAAPPAHLRPTAVQGCNRRCALPHTAQLAYSEA